MCCSPGLFSAAKSDLLKSRPLRPPRGTDKVINVRESSFLAPWDRARWWRSPAGPALRDLADGAGQTAAPNPGGGFRSLPQLRDLGCPVIFKCHPIRLQQPGGQGTSSGGQREIRGALGPRRRGRGREWFCS